MFLFFKLVGLVRGRGREGLLPIAWSWICLFRLIEYFNLFYLIYVVLRYFHGLMYVCSRSTSYACLSSLVVSSITSVSLKGIQQGPIVVASFLNVDLAFPYIFSYTCCNPSIDYRRKWEKERTEERRREKNIEWVLLLLDT